MGKKENKKKLIHNGKPAVLFSMFMGTLHFSTDGICIDVDCGDFYREVELDPEKTKELYEVMKEFYEDNQSPN